MNPDRDTAMTRPSAGLNRIVVIAQLEQHQAQVMARIAREVDGNLDDERGQHIPSPAELRGIPAIGRGVAGAIRHTSPHGALSDEAS